MGREAASRGQSPSTSRWDPRPADFFLPPSPPSAALPHPSPSHRAAGIGPHRKKKTAQFVMSCPAVNLPLPSHREDLLSSIYLFATWTMEGPRPAELFIITPPTIPPHRAPPPQPAAPAEELQVSAGINPCGAPGSLERPGCRWGGSRQGLQPELGGLLGRAHVKSPA